MLQTPDSKPEVLRNANHPRILYYLTGIVTIMDFMPIRHACRFAVHDEAGLLNCDTITTEALIKRIRPFTDPFTTESGDCPESWLIPLRGRDPAFFPDCPGAQREGQGQPQNEQLRQCVRAGKVQAAISTLAAGADPNTWDTAGRTPFHDLCDITRSGRIDMQGAVQIAAELLLAHGDPYCRDRAGQSVLDTLRQPGTTGSRAAATVCCPELHALMESAALSVTKPGHTAALHTALEVLGEPRRSRLARILDFSALRPFGEAELSWRNPPPDEETILAQIDEELRAVEQLSEVERKKAMKKLLLAWHPDKNADRLSLATTVFQYVQAHKFKVIAK